MEKGEGEKKREEKGEGDGRGKSRRGRTNVHLTVRFYCVHSIRMWMSNNIQLYPPIRLSAD